MSWVDQITGGYSFVVYVFLVIFITLLVNYILSRTYKRLSSKFQTNHRIWEIACINSIHRPLSYLVWLYGFLVAADILITHYHDSFISPALPFIRSVGAVIFFVWFCVNFIREAEEALLKPRPGKPPQDPTTTKAIGHLLRVAVIVTAGLVLMQTFRIPISGVVAAGGVGGIGIALAAKDLLANFFGGFMIFLDRPFKIGDWIRSPDRNIEGYVETIGWRLTRIRTFEKRPLYVPNSVFSTIALENPSRMSNRRIKATVGLRYEDSTKVKGVLEKVTKMLQTHPGIDTNKVLFVHFIDFGPSSLNFQIYTFTKTTEWVAYLAVQQEVFLKIIDIIHEAGAQCAFPTTTLHVPEPINIEQ